MEYKGRRSFGSHSIQLSDIFPYVRMLKEFRDGKESFRGFLGAKSFPLIQKIGNFSQNESTLSRIDWRFIECSGFL